MADLVPFGKYKGQPVEALRADQAYADWLVAQDWFRERYQPIYQFIINNFSRAGRNARAQRVAGAVLGRPPMPRVAADAGLEADDRSVVGGAGRVG